MSDPIRILIIGMHDKIGGVETFLMNYYRNIDRKKIQFDFISTYDKLCFEEEILELHGRIYKVCSEKKNPIRYYNQLKQIIKRNNYRIIHINMLSAANILPIISAKKAKVKHIIIHSHNSNTPSGIVRKILNSINKPFLHMGTDFFACSKLAGEWLFGKRFLKSHKLVLINNAIDIKKYQYNKEIRDEVRKRLNIDDKLVIGHIGRFCYQKNHDFLIDVFNEVQRVNKNAILLLIGEGELEETIKKKVNDLKLDEKVVFLGTTNKVEEYLQAMDIFVLPSRFEGLPVVGVEAQISGTTCIFSKNITEEAKINNNTKFLELNDNHKLWAKEILNANIDKNCKEAYISKEQYDIKKTSRILSQIYIKMQNINIMHVLYGLGNGGVETLIYNYFSGVNTYNLSIVTQECDNEDVRKKFIDEGFYIYKVSNKKKIIKYMNDFIKIIKKESPDIIHCHMTMGNFVPCAIALFTGVKIRISHSHFAFADMKIKNKIYSKLGKIFANEYVACTNDAANYLFGKDANKAYILKNAIDLNKFKFDEDIRKNIRENLNISENYVIGNVGRLTKQKNHMFLIDLFYEVYKKNENARLLLVGDGELKEDIEKKVEDLDIKNEVIFLSNRCDVNKLMMGMDIFLFPTLFEGLGIVLIEAQASGLKCISSNNVPKDVILTDRIKLLDLKHEEKWIENLLENKKLDREVDFSNFIRNGYDIETERKKLIDYYEETLRRKKCVK